MVLALTATGCLTACSSQPKEYDSVGQLVTAWKAAGGPCEDPADVTEAMVGAGAHAQLCTPGVNMLLVFDSDESTNRYLASVIDGETQDVIAGPRWVAVGDHAANYAGSLGGEVKVQQKAKS